MRWIEVGETVRFNEVDEWGMVWHGHYPAWFEIGRMSLLRQFDLLPAQLVELGYIAPVISLKCEYKGMASSCEEITIRTTVIKPETASLVFRFEILRKADRGLLGCGETTQILMTTARKMVYKLEGELARRIDKMVAHCRLE